MEPIRTTDDQGEWRVGDAVSTFEGIFNWAVIIGFLRWPGWTEAVLIRPFVYAHDYGTVEASPAMTWERYTARLETLKRPPGREWTRGQPPAFLLASDLILASRGDHPGAVQRQRDPEPRESWSRE